MKAAEAACFAAKAHTGQKRKGARQEPYVNHLAEVALLVAQATQGGDVDLLVAAWLHDAVEDQSVSAAEIAERFGQDVADLVFEVTDDKSLPKEVRKRRQVETAAAKSPRARLLKLADKTSNLIAIVDSPPSDWDIERLRDYVEWAIEVVDAGCRGLNPALEAQFDTAAKRARSVFADLPE